MPTRKRSQVTGLKECNEVLKRLPERVQKRVLANAVRAGATVVNRAVKAAAPVGDEKSPASKQYGSIKQNIRVQRLRKVPKTAAGHRVWTKDAFWAMFYEFGTSRQPARPFFRPAWDASLSEAVARIRERLAAGVEREAKKLAGEYKVAKKSLGVRRR